MTSKAIRQIHTAQVPAQFGPIVQEVAATDVPIIVQTPSGERAALISLRDLERLWPPEGEDEQAAERARVSMALRAVGLLSEPTPQEIAEVQAFKTQHPCQDQERILSEWRELDIVPPLSEIILRNREQVQ